MKHYILPGLLAICLALGLGIWSADYLSQNFEGFSDLQSGPWSANTRIGTRAADPYVNANIVRSGLLPLGSAEGLQFTAETDSSGDLLNSSCDYIVSGRMPATRLWTLHIASAEGVNVETGGVHSRGIVYGAQNSVLISVSRQTKPLNWIEQSLDEAETFKLVATLYDTAIAGGTRLGDLVMPAISKGTCRDQ